MTSQLYRQLKAESISSEDIDDFESIIFSHFPKSTHPPRRTVFLDEKDRPVLEVLYTKSGKIENIKNHTAKPELIEEIIKHLEVDLFSAPQWSVASTVVFAPAPVRGYFRRSDQWQLREMFPEAPRPAEALAPHPAIFEFRFRTASDAWTRMQRQRRAETEALLILNGLLTAKLESAKNNAMKIWVLGDPPKHTPELRHVGYWYDKGGLNENFSSTEGLPLIPSTDADAYYNRIGIDIAQPLDLPSDLNQTLELFNGLDFQSKSQFLRASYWAAHALQVFQCSRSASMVAAISSVEALSTPKEMRTLANGQVVDVVKAFNDVISCTLGNEFVKRHALYNIRSELAHGSRLMIRDSSGPGLLGERGRVDDAAMRFVHQILPFILHNWLSPVVRAEIVAATKQLPFFARVMGCLLKWQRKVFDS